MKQQARRSCAVPVSFPRDISLPTLFTERGIFNMTEEMIFGLAGLLGAIAAVCLLFTCGDVIMRLLERVPCVKRLMDRLYNSLPMSDDNWH